MSAKVWQKTKDQRIKKRGSWYWARFEKRNIVVQESLNTQSFEVAKSMVGEIEKNILLGVNWRKERELFETAWPEFLIDKAQGNKTKIARPKTMYLYTQYGETHFKKHFNDLRLTDLNEEAWEKFVLDVRKDSPDIQFFNFRKYLMGFLSWAKRKGKIRELPALFDPDAKAKSERESAGPGKAFTTAELQKMRDSAKDIPNFHVFLLMAQYMGMRPSEITQLRRDRIDFKKGVIALRKSDTKTHRARLVPIHPHVLAPLESQYEQSGDSDYLFPNRSDRRRPMDSTGFKARWQNALDAAGTSGRIYDLRHTFITHAIKAGVRIDVVAEITGTSIKVIQKHYLHLEPSDLTREIGKVLL